MDSVHLSGLRPGHTEIYGLITAIPRPKVVSREADVVVRVEAELRPGCQRATAVL